MMSLRIDRFLLVANSQWARTVLAFRHIDKAPVTDGCRRAMALEVGLLSISITYILVNCLDKKRARHSVVRPYASMYL